MASEKRVDTASKLIDASAKTIYSAFSDANAWTEWLPPNDMTGTIAEFDFREGGQYRLTLTYTDGSGAGKSSDDEDVVEGTFVQLLPDKRIMQQIVFESDDPTFAGTMLMTWSLEPSGDGTLVTIAAENVPSSISPEDHASGLQSTLDNLARFVEEGE